MRGGAESKVTLTVVDDTGGEDNPNPPPVPPETFSVTVPTTIPISMGLSGKITVPTDLEIVNNNDSGIKLISVDVQVADDWKAVDFDNPETSITEASPSEAERKISFAFRGDKMNSQGLIDVTPESWNFAPNGELPINAKVKIPKQSTTYESNIASISWEFDWSNSDVSSDPSIGNENDTPTGQAVTVTFIEPEGVTIKGSKTVELKVGDKLTFPDIELNGIRYEVENWIDSDTKEVLGSDYVVTKDTNVSLTLKEKEANPKNWFTAAGNTLTGLSDEYLNMVDAPTDLIIPNNIGGSKITTIGANAFANKDLLTSVIVPNTVTSIDATAFTGTSADLKIDVSYADYLSIPNAPWGSTFSNILWKPGTDDWDTDHITASDMENRGLTQLVDNSVAIDYNTKLTEINIPTSIDNTKITTIGSKGTNTNYYITQVNIPDTVTSIEKQAFYDLNKLETINIPNSVTTIGSDAFGKCSVLGEVKLPNTLNKIEDSSFYSCTALKTINIPNSVTTIGKSAFYECKELTSITIPNSVTTIEAGAFMDTGIDELSVPSSVIQIGTNAFDKILYVNYDGVATGAPWGAVKIWNSSETKVAWDSDPVTSEELGNRGMSFQSDTSQIILTSVPQDYIFKIPSSVDGHRVMYVWEILDSEEEKLVQEVHFPVCMYKIADVNNFGVCVDFTNLNKVIMPKYLKVINNYAFKGCSNLIDIQIPDGVEKIYKEAFNHCSNLQSLIVPNSVTFIGTNAFLNVPEVKYSGTATGSPWGALSVVPNN